MMRSLVQSTPSRSSFGGRNSNNGNFQSNNGNNRFQPYDRNGGNKFGRGNANPGNAMRARNQNIRNDFRRGLNQILLIPIEKKRIANNKKLHNFFF